MRSFSLLPKEGHLYYFEKEEYKLIRHEYDWQGNLIIHCERVEESVDEENQIVVQEVLV